jgi:hypothetical protein
LANDPEAIGNARKIHMQIITAEELHRRGVAWVLSQIEPAENVYVSFDVDSLDSTLASGTGTLEPGGLNFAEIDDLMIATPSKGKLAGLDIMEVNPITRFQRTNGPDRHPADGGYARLGISLSGKACYVPGRPRISPSGKKKPANPQSRSASIRFSRCNWPRVSILLLRATDGSGLRRAFLESGTGSPRPFSSQVPNAHGSFFGGEDSQVVSRKQWGQFVWIPSLCS